MSPWSSRNALLVLPGNPGLDVGERVIVSPLALAVDGMQLRSEDQPTGRPPPTPSRAIRPPYRIDVRPRTSPRRCRDETTGSVRDRKLAGDEHVDDRRAGLWARSVWSSCVGRSFRDSSWKSCW